jgi:hypothetical protein
VNHEHLGCHRYDLEGTSCPVLLVGEDNPLSINPADALYPYPVGCAGYNFAENIANVGSGHQLATWRTNLCLGRWSTKAARERAAALVLTGGVPWRVIVALGRRVGDAFERALSNYDPPLEVEPFTTNRVLNAAHRNEIPDPALKLDWITLVSLPHPSGRNQIWNRPDQVHRARGLLASAAPTWYGDAPVR